MDTTERYVTNDYEFDSPTWHRVDEQKTGVYTVYTHYGKSFQYPTRAVVFRHPKEDRRTVRARNDCSFCE